MPPTQQAYSFINKHLRHPTVEALEFLPYLPVFLKSLEVDMLMRCIRSLTVRHPASTRNVSMSDELSVKLVSQVQHVPFVIAFFVAAFVAARRYRTSPRR